MKRSGTANHQFVQRIPTDVATKAIGQKLYIPVDGETVTLTVSPKMRAVQISLRTTVAREAKTRQAQVAAYLATVWHALRSQHLLPISPKEAHGMAKRFYTAWREDHAKERTTALDYDRATGGWVPASLDPELPELAAEGWEAASEGLIAAAEKDLDAAFGPHLDRLLMAEGYAGTDRASRYLALNAFLQAMKDGLANRQRQAAGDFTPDPNANRFPEWTPPAKPEALSTGSATSLMDLLDGWWKEAEPLGHSPNTYRTRKNTVLRFKEVLGHDDAQRITKDDVIAFRDARLAEGKSWNTVYMGDMATLRALFAWALAHPRLGITANPAEGIKAPVKSRPKVTRSKGFTPEEASALLAHADGVKAGNKDTAWTVRAKRWVPWLCAYTGARVSEVVQMRKQDLRKEGDNWVLTITPDAGSVKTGQYREVVLHADLVEQGFPGMVEGLKSDAVFTKGGTPLEVSNMNTVLVAFARKVVTDPAVRPNHGWRHLFKTVGREVGISDSILDAICGHAAKSVGQGYGSVTIRAQAEALGKFPKFRLAAVEKA
ncbi:tyrosine-type recombinase/integrase [Aminobacter sp. HY435]|uniref:tyrosine-type recombinase/integrase n=1 Tax=Aminobacter sp. HY435 TaxID=2970917 RepID=UPI0022B94C6B|nr:tyrosine-type recombinase/integrase [Aminobacter sp. HY435]